MHAAQLRMESTAQAWAPTASVEGAAAPGVDDVVLRYLASLVKSEQFHVHATVNQFRNQARAGLEAGAAAGYQGKDVQQPTLEGDEGDAAMAGGSGANKMQESAAPRTWRGAEIDWSVVAMAAAAGTVCGLVGGRLLSR